MDSRIIPAAVLAGVGAVVVGAGRTAQGQHARSLSVVVTADQLAELRALAAEWQREHDQQTAELGIGPMNHNPARLSGLLRRIEEAN